MQNLIIASTSTIYNGDYLDYLLEELKELYKEAATILFIPYARPGGISYNAYTNKAQTAFSKINKKVIGIHEFENPIEAIKKAQGIFVGGGNTFVLVHALYENNSMGILKTVINSGTPYLGTSAGSNICGVNMKTTNDMPIIYPPSFNTLNLVPFNINPHYLDPDTNSTHMGETRETRIKEFHEFNDRPVIGLREGSWIRVKNNSLHLKGTLSARVFKKDKKPFEIKTETCLNNYF